jgi:heme exporter protein C
MLAIVIASLSGLLYLWRKEDRWDWLARASAEIGTVFTTITILLGSIWGKAIWGTWWSWNPKLTATLILGLFM